MYFVYIGKFQFFFSSKKKCMPATGNHFTNELLVIFLAVYRIPCYLGRSPYLTLFSWLSSWFIVGHKIKELQKVVDFSQPKETSSNSFSQESERFMYYNKLQQKQWIKMFFCSYTCLYFCLCSLTQIHIFSPACTLPPDTRLTASCVSFLILVCTKFHILKANYRPRPNDTN